MKSRILLAVAASVMLMASASAQSPQQRRQDGFVRVQSTLNFFVPGPAGDSDTAEKLREDARRKVYAMAARECDLLKETLASECRLEAITSNLSAARQYGQAQQEGFTINGSMSFQITLK